VLINALEKVLSNDVWETAPKGRMHQTNSSTADNVIRSASGESRWSRCVILKLVVTLEDRPRRMYLVTEKVVTVGRNKAAAAVSANCR